MKTYFICVLNFVVFMLAGFGNTAISKEQRDTQDQSNPPLVSEFVSDSIASNIHFSDNENASLFTHRWNHGTSDCETQKEPVLEIYQQDADTFVIRQSKCSSFEAPFLYLFMGKKTALLIDTGAAENIDDVPLLPVIQSLISTRYHSRDISPELLVIHSHSHGDHVAGDAQFDHLPNTRIVGTSQSDIQAFFQFDNDGFASIELGQRTVKVLFTPGHQEEAISVYDPQTQWLITGDTVYPGLVYVKNWLQYQSSINKLTQFGTKHEIKAVLGGHIEMSQTPGEIYPIGTTFQPKERPLALTYAHLQQLNATLQTATEPQEIKHDNIIVMPMNGLQRSLSNVMRWLF